MAEAKSDYERRLKVLTHCLEEKAEENVTLAESNRELHQKFVQLDQKLKHLVEENTSTDKDNSSKNRERSNKEIEKKLEMMAETLNILASDNISLRSLNDECEKNKKFGKGDKSARDSEKKAPVGKAKSAKAQEDEYIANLKKEVLRLSQIEESCDESVLLYENTIKEMNQKMKIALKKEQERRKKAEFDVQRLKQKIEELDFLLSDKEDTFSWSSNSEDEEKEDKKDKKSSSSDEK